MRSRAAEGKTELACQTFWAPLRCARHAADRRGYPKTATGQCAAMAIGRYRIASLNTTSLASKGRSSRRPSGRCSFPVQRSMALCIIRFPMDPQRTVYYARHRGPNRPARCFGSCPRPGFKAIVSTPRFLRPARHPVVSRSCQTCLHRIRQSPPFCRLGGRGTNQSPFIPKTHNKP